MRKFIKTDALNYIKEQESKDISYVKIGKYNKKLVVCFASNAHNGFERKSSLMELKEERNDFDVLYLRNLNKWYIGGLNGIGKNITHTISFLKKQFSAYENIICVGISSGGYASILFGSICEVDEVITFMAQTDIEYVINNLCEVVSKKIKISHNNNNGLQKLIKRRKECSSTWKTYSSLKNIICNKTNYLIAMKGDDTIKKYGDDLFLHGDYHFNIISHHLNVRKLNSHGEKEGRNIIHPSIIDCLDNKSRLNK